MTWSRFFSPPGLAVGPRHGATSRSGLVEETHPDELIVDILAPMPSPEVPETRLRTEGLRGSLVGRIGHFDFFWIVAPIVVLVAITASLRIYCLGCHSLWLDEISTASVLMQPSLQDAFRYGSSFVDHTPLHFLLTWLAGGLGRDEFAVRIPYATAGTLAALATYHLGSQLGGRTIAWAAGTFAAVLPFEVYYSQESRPTILVILLTVSLMSVAYSAAHRGSILQWTLLAFLSVAGIYTSYLILMVAGVAYGYCALIRLWTLFTDARSRRDLRPSAVQALLWFVSGILVVAAFLPWRRHFADFLAAPDVGFGRANAGPLTLNATTALLTSLDLHGPLLCLLVIGIVTAVVTLVRKRSDKSLLLLMWFFLPLAFFAIRTGSGILTIWPRYFVVDYAAAVMLAAMGVWGSGRLVVSAIVKVAPASRRLLSGFRLPRPPAVRLSVSSVAYFTTCGILIAMVGMDALPADAASYSRPKGGDYRGGVDRILSADSDRPVLLVVGPYPGWVVSGLQYYAWARDSHLVIFDALRLTDADLAQLKSATSLWVAGYSDPVPPATNPAGPGRESYLDFWLLPSAGSVASRADAVLDWAAQFEPALSGVRQLVDLTFGEVHSGPELLPRPTRSSAWTGAPIADFWAIQPGTAVSGTGSGFVLQPGGGEIGAVYSTRSLPRGGSYLLTVGCDPHALTGQLAVHVVLTSSAGSLTLPDEAGYWCSGGAPASTAMIPFVVTAQSTTVTIYLNASGVGIGTFDNPSLRQLK
jgi:4-amino-4-deoxy-L-arabinose transferase-like glycosyltransferase